MLQLVAAHRSRSALATCRGSIVVEIAHAVNYNPEWTLPLNASSPGNDPMPKALCILGMAVAAILLLLFGLDLGLGIPFGKVSMMMNVGFIICAVVLAYLSWSTFREQT